MDSMQIFSYVSFKKASCFWRRLYTSHFLTDGPMVNSLKEANQLVDVLMSSSVGEVASEASASFSSPCMLD